MSEGRSTGSRKWFSDHCGGLQALPALEAVMTEKHLIQVFQENVKEQVIGQFSVHNKSQVSCFNHKDGFLHRLFISAALLPLTVKMCVALLVLAIAC